MENCSKKTGDVELEEKTTTPKQSKGKSSSVRNGKNRRTKQRTELSRIRWPNITMNRTPTTTWVYPKGTSCTSLALKKGDW